MSDVIYKRPLQPQFKGQDKLPLAGKHKRKLIIAGTADTMAMIPWTDESYEIWAVAQCSTFPVFKRADILFELHQESYWKGTPNVLERIKSVKYPTYMMKHYREIPHSVKFPIDEMTRLYRRYHTTSITYMMAFAIHLYLTEGSFEHIAFFGVHMAAREEYTVQRPCCEYWMGIMEGLGIDVFLAPGGSLLASDGLYAYEGYHPAIPKMRLRLDGLRMGAVQREQEKYHAEYMRHKQLGAVEECEHWLRLFQTGEILKEGSTAKLVQKSTILPEILPEETIIGDD